MSAELVVSLVLGVLTAIPAVIIAVATLVQTLRTQHQVAELSRGLNGRLDQLLLEREQRIRAEAAAETERQRIATAAAMAAQSRPEVVVRHLPPEQDDR